MIAARPYLAIRTSEEAQALLRALKTDWEGYYLPAPYPGVWFLNSKGVLSRMPDMTYFDLIPGFPLLPTNSISQFVASVNHWRRVPR
jgi:hypothetical protein